MIFASTLHLMRELDVTCPSSSTGMRGVCVCVRGGGGVVIMHKWGGVTQNGGYYFLCVIAKHTNDLMSYFSLYCAVGISAFNHSIIKKYYDRANMLSQLRAKLGPSCESEAIV